MQRSRALVLGAGGFIGSHMVRRLKAEGFFVRGADLRHPAFEATQADELEIGDLNQAGFVARVLEGGFDEVYQFAADMGGAGYIFTGDHDADIMRNSALINLNLLDAVLRGRPVGSIFYSSSACVYPAFNQTDPANPVCAEDSAYPASPDSEYGWEKLFSERLYQASARQHGLKVRIARYHNIFGPLGTYDGGREKAPAALCRKVAATPDGGEIEVWGPGTQTRSFLFVDECIEGTLRLMRSDVDVPVNIGSEEMISINGLAQMVAEVSGKRIAVRNVPGPLGVMGRNSDNTRLRARLGWQPSLPLRTGIEKTYRWIEQRLAAR